MLGMKIAVNPIHLGLGATASAEPAFTGSMDWYAGYVERHPERPDGWRHSRRQGAVD